MAATFVPARRRRRWDRPALAGVVLLGAILLLGLVLYPLLHLDPIAQDLQARLLPPLSADAAGRLHLLGTDDFGRDMLARVAGGVRTSLAVAATAVVIAACLGTFVGLVSGYLGGTLDDGLMLLADIQLAVPRLLLLIVVVAIFGTNLLTIALFLGLSGWMTYARLSRGIALSLRQREFVLAAIGLGATTPRLLSRHVLPNALPPLAVLASYEVGQMILLESTLSFLGLGVQPPTPAWGSMIADGAIYMRSAAWIMLAPGLAIFATVLAASLIARLWSQEGRSA